MSLKYVKLSPEDRCLLQALNKNICKLGGETFSGQLEQGGEPVSDTNPLPVQFTGGGDASAANQVIGNSSLDSIDDKIPALVAGRLPVDGSGVTQPISASSLPLPTNASTSAGQTAGNASLSSIDSKTPVLGQALAAGSVPVVFTAAQQAALTPPSSVTANAGTNLNTSALALESGGNLAAIATNGFISNNNSSIATLGSGAVFTGTSEDVTQYSTISVSVISNVASAVDGLSIQQSPDGINWDYQDNYTVPAGVGKAFSVARNAKFYRVVYTNGGTIQGSFRLQTVFTKGAVKSSSVRPQDSRTNDNDMEENLSYPMMYDELTGLWDRMRSSVTATGNITTQNLVPAGVATANSAVEINLRGATSLTIQTTGTYTGALTFQVTLDGVTWKTLNSTTSVLDQAVGTYNSAIASGIQSVFKVDTIGALRARITALAAVTGTATVTLRGNFGATAMTSLSTGLPSSANSIGSIAQISTSVTPGTAAANLGKAEDAPHTSGDTGIATWYVRQDTQTVSTSGNNDYSLMAGDMYGNGLIRSYQTIRKTYSVSFNVTLDAAATDIVEMIGSTASIQITKIIIGGTATAAFPIGLSLIRKSSLATGGSSSSITPINHETGDGASTAVVKAYTANPTVGATVGRIRTFQLSLGTTAAYAGPVEFNFGTTGKPFLLTGAAQTLCLSTTSTVPAGTRLDVNIEFTEL